MAQRRTKATSGGSALLGFWDSGTLPPPVVGSNADPVRLATGHPQFLAAISPPYTWGSTPSSTANGSAVLDGHGVEFTPAQQRTLSLTATVGTEGNHRLQLGVHLPADGTLNVTVDVEGQTRDSQVINGPQAPTFYNSPTSADYNVITASVFVAAGETITITLDYASGTGNMLLDFARFLVSAGAPSLFANDVQFSPADPMSRTYDIMANDDFTPGANITLSDNGGGNNVNTPTFNNLTGEMTYRPHGSEYSQPGGSVKVVTIEYLVEDSSSGQSDTATVTINVPAVLVADKARPNAHGFGRFTLGARKNYDPANKPTIFSVTNTNDSGAGSFRDACEASGPRVVMVSTGGTVDLLTMLRIENNDITILGEVAPQNGDGLQIRNGDHPDRPFWIRCNECIISQLRVRPGALPRHVDYLGDARCKPGGLIEFPSGQAPGSPQVGDRIKVFGSSDNTNNRGSFFSSRETYTEFQSSDGTTWTCSLSVPGVGTNPDFVDVGMESNITVIASRDKALNAGIYANGFGKGQLNQLYVYKCSTQFHTDEGNAPTKVKNWTYDLCLMCWPVAGGAPSGARGKSFLVGISEDGGPGTLVEGMMAGSSDRNPRITNDDHDTIEIISNMSVHNERWFDTADDQNTGDPNLGPRVNAVGNYFIEDSNPNRASYEYKNFTTHTDTQTYLLNNRGFNRTSPTDPETAIVDVPSNSIQAVVGSAHPGSDINYMNVPDPFDDVNGLEAHLDANVGVTLPVRDPLDTEALAQIQARTIAIITDETDVGDIGTVDSRGFPVLAAGSQTDTNGDGVPDSFDLNGIAANEIANAGPAGTVGSPAKGYLGAEAYAFSLEGLPGF